MKVFACSLFALVLTHCASTQITEKLAKQTIKNAEAIEVVKSSGIPIEKQRVIVDALMATQDIAAKADRQVTDLKEDVADLKPFRAAVWVGGVLIFLGVGLYFKMR